MSKKWCLSGAALLCAYISTRTQVILVHLHFLHERGHHEGEGLPVEVVEHVAHKHAEKYGPPVVSIACRGHGCRSRCRERVSQKHGNKSQLPLPPSSSESCACRPPARPPATATFASGSAVHSERSNVEGRWCLRSAGGRLMVNLLYLISSGYLAGITQGSWGGGGKVRYRRQFRQRQQ